MIRKPSDSPFFRRLFSDGLARADRETGPMQSATHPNPVPCVTTATYQDTDETHLPSASMPASLTRQEPALPNFDWMQNGRPDVATSGPLMNVSSARSTATYRHDHPLLIRRISRGSHSSASKAESSYHPTQIIGPDPGELGQLPFSEQSFAFRPQSSPLLVKCGGQLYTSPQNSFGPLVLIHTADGIGFPASLQYQSLGRHLASYGFHVAVISKSALSQGLAEASLLQETVHYLYGDNTSPFNLPSPLKGRLSNDVVLIGHSAGGRLAIQGFNLIKNPSLPFVTPRKLRSLVLYAPAFSPIPHFSTFSEFMKSWNAHSPDSDVDSFLGIHVVQDRDPHAYGKKQTGEPMMSTFLVYDMFGRNDQWVTGVEKDMVFVQWMGAKPHAFQNELFTRAYTTAFLLKNVLGQTYFEQFLKNQVRPPSLLKFGDNIWQQHDERQRIIVLDFDHDYNFPVTSTIETSPHGIAAFAKYESKWDSTSPHFSKVLKLFWDRTTMTSQAGDNWLRIKFSSALSLPASLKYFTFRIGQGFPAMLGQVPMALDVRVAFSNGKSVLLSQVSTKVRYPIEFSFEDPEVEGTAIGTKSAMRTYVIPLSLFRAGLQTPLSTDWIQFTLSLPANGNNKASFNMDSFAFWA